MFQLNTSKWLIALRQQTVLCCATEGNEVWIPLTGANELTRALASGAVIDLHDLAPDVATQALEMHLLEASPETRASWRPAQKITEGWEAVADQSAYALPDAVLGSDWQLPGSGKPVFMT